MMLIDRGSGSPEDRFQIKVNHKGDMFVVDMSKDGGTVSLDEIARLLNRYDKLRVRVANLENRLAECQNLLSWTHDKTSWGA